MKTLQILLVLLAICISSTTQAQEKNNTENDTTKQMNLLDKQTEVLAPIFAMMEMDGAEQFNDISKFMQLIELSNLAPDMKQHLREQYKLYDLTLDPVKKDSAKLVFNKMLKEAMVKSAKKDK